jgi:2,3-bisphosphoglycerate-independent phosphoglycerate mutase
MQDLPKIDLAIKNNTLETMPILVDMMKKLKESNGTCHLMGLMSPGGVHSHQKHFEALCKILNKNGIKVNVHAFLDGRDTPPQSALGFVEDFENNIKNLNNVKVATISGRFYAMDRDKRWDRVELAYNNIVSATGNRFATSSEAIAESYKNSVTDEFVVPVVIGDYNGANDGDAVLMVNYRADRAREILYALGDKEFNGFERKKIVNFVELVGMTEYSVDHKRFMKTIFEPESLTNIFGEVVANHGLTQLRIAETEK